MANSISGNVGIAGATVVAIGYGTATSFSTTADGSGNYTLSGLSADTYFVTPSIAGNQFTPYTSKQTIVASDITGVNFVATAFTPSNVWTKQGSINLITPQNTGSAILKGTQTGTVLYDTNPQLISPNPDGKVFKAWYMDGDGIYYAESATGPAGTWTSKVGAVLASRSWPTVFKNGSTYYMFSGVGVLPPAIGLHTSTDGINWTLQNASVLTPGGVGTWDHSGLYQLTVVDNIAGTWYGLYTGFAALASSKTTISIGLATSTDLVNWTKAVGGTGGPVIFNASAPYVKKVGSSYYVWFNWTNFYQATSAANQWGIPSDVYRTQSTDLLNWSGPIPSLPRTLLAEGAGNPNGQTGNPWLAEKDGNTYMFYMGTTQGAGSSSKNFVTLLATAPLTIAELVQTNEGVLTSPQLAIDTCQRANENPLSNGGTWATVPNSFGPLQLTSNLIEPIALSTWGQMVRTGVVWPSGQYAESILNTNTSTSIREIYINLLVTSGASGANDYSLGFEVGNIPSSQQVKLYKETNGSGIVLTSATLTVAAGDWFRLQRDPATGLLTVYQNGSIVSALSIVDNTWTSGSPGIQLFNSQAIANSTVSAWAGGSTAVIPLPSPRVPPSPVTYAGDAPMIDAIFPVLKARIRIAMAQRNKE